MSESKSDSLENFAYRHNNDDTWDAICLQCFLTAGTAGDKKGLAEFEAQHDCKADVISPRFTHRHSIRKAPQSRRGLLRFLR